MISTSGSGGICICHQMNTFQNILSLHGFVSKNVAAERDRYESEEPTMW